MSKSALPPCRPTPQTLHTLADHGKRGSESWTAVFHRRCAFRRLQTAVSDHRQSVSTNVSATAGRSYLSDSVDTDTVEDTLLIQLPAH